MDGRMNEWIDGIICFLSVPFLHVRCSLLNFCLVCGKSEPIIFIIARSLKKACMCGVQGCRGGRQRQFLKALIAHMKQTESPIWRSAGRKRKREAGLAQLPNAAQACSCCEPQPGGKRCSQEYTPVQLMQKKPHVRLFRQKQETRVASDQTQWAGNDLAQERPHLLVFKATLIRERNTAETQLSWPQSATPSLPGAESKSRTTSTTTCLLP